MFLRLKRISSLALLMVFILILLSANYHCALAQEKDGKTAPKTEKSIMPLVTFVEIGSVNCIPCRAMQPIMKAVEEEFGEQVNVVFHDVWTPKGKIDAAKYNIRVIPTQVFLDKDGKEYFRHEGYHPKAEVERVLKTQGVK
ncbi:MAG TPA: thioredoxin family protein [Smithellaceae bacterium]|nr:thioredoxin family protein [Smithellaceae bacterium]